MDSRIVGTFVVKVYCSQLQFALTSIQVRLYDYKAIYLVASSFLKYYFRILREELRFWNRQKTIS